MITLEFLFSQLHMMLNDKWGYIWGQSGAIWTAEKQKNATREMTVKYGSKWIGHHVADCSGVMVYIWKQCGLKIPHGSNSIVKQGYVIEISDTPKAGYAALVYKDGDYSHIGIVAEDGEHVYEAKGTINGFVYSDRKAFNRYGKFKDVDYGGNMETLYYAEVATEKGSLNVRSGNGKSFPVIFKLPKGSIVSVLIEYDNGWDFISDEKGRQGYCDASYLKRIEKPLDPDEDPKEYTTLINSDGTEIEIVGKWKVKD